MMKRYLPPLLLAAATLLAGCSQEDSSAAALPPPDSTAQVAFSLPDLEGNTRQLAEWQGQVVMLNFWAPWCPPCVKEMPDLIRLQESYGPRGLTIVGITIDTRENAQNFIDTLDINYPILIGEDKGIQLAQGYGNKVGALPFTAVIDRQGRVVYTHRSEISFEEAAKLIAPLL